MARKRKRKRPPKLDLGSWSTSLLWDRIPLSCSAYDRDVKRKADALGAEFTRAHPHLSHEDTMPEDILEVMLPWVRARGYPVLDEPVCAYATYRKEARRLWGPPLEPKNPESHQPPGADGDGRSGVSKA